MPKLLAVEKESDIPEPLARTPIGELLRFQNLGAPLRERERVELLLGTCMDGRIRLRLPEGFAFVLRAGGADFRRNGFHISFAVAVQGLRFFALVGHTRCGMSGIDSKRDAFLEGLRDAGWTEDEARRHFEDSRPEFEIGDPAAFVLGEARRLSENYPGLTVVPLLYRLEDHRLYPVA